MAGAQLKRLAIAGIVIGVLLLIAVLPGYLATRPGFFARYPDLTGKYEPWSKSTHVETGCQDCHVPPKMLAQAAYRVRMVGEFYTSLITRSRVPSVFGKPTNDACLKCHYDLRSVSPKGDLRIPHKAHVSVLKMDCVECHDYLVHEKNPAGKHTPTMKGCLRCHDGDTADNACTACHTEKAAPATHRAKNWASIHASDAVAPGAKCKDCHEFTDKWCADCHSRRPRSHTRDWRKVHRVAVEQHRNCEACHEAPFCIRCHGEVPPLNFDPAIKIVQ